MLRNITTIVSPLIALLLVAPGCDKGPQGAKADPGKNKKTPPATKVAKATDTKAETKTDDADKKKPVVRTLDGKVYGKKLTESKSVSISQILDNPKDYEGKLVRVEGMVTDVCPRRGCWINLAGDKPGKKMRFKVRDGVITFPMKEKGNYAVAEGVVRVKKLTLEQTRNFLAHMAEEKGEKFDKSKVTAARTIISLDGKGAVIRARK